METARSVFHAQVASIMDVLLAGAVGEIAALLERSLRLQQAELRQKTEQVSVLRAELEAARRRGAGTSLDPDQVQCQSGSGIKEEPLSVEEDDESKPEESKLISAAVQTSSLVPFSPVQCKDEVLDESHAAAQLHHEDASPPVLSTSSKVRSDSSQTEGWASELSASQESTMENVQANKPTWLATMNRHNEFGSDECLDDTYGNILEQDPGNLASCHDIVQSFQREGGLTTHIKQSDMFKSRGRLQSSLHSFSLPNSDSLSNFPSAGGASGRPYSCLHCGKCFTYPSQQRRHLLWHTGVRLHPCQYCEKSFLTPSELAVHTRTHTGERPFGCGQCGKHFARSGNLRAHQRDVHLGKRPFACTQCGKRFAHKGNLRVHNHRVHHGLLLPATLA